MIYASKYILLYYRISSTPLTTIAEAKTGLVSIEGKAQSYNNQNVTAPSKKTCLWYTYTVKLASRADYAPGNAVSTTPFLLKDNTGSTIIKPPNKFSLTDYKFIVDLYYYADDRSAVSVVSDSWFSNSVYINDQQGPESLSPTEALANILSAPYKWTEWRIGVDQDIFIHGMFDAGEITKPAPSFSTFIISNSSREQTLKFIISKIRLGCLIAGVSIIIGGICTWGVILNGG